MSISSHIFWPDAASNEATIAPLQSVGADLTVKIQSNQPNMPNVPVNNSGIYYYNSMLRTISFNSASDLQAMGVRFTVTGLSAPVDGDGNPTETLSVFTEGPINAPNPDPTFSARVYARIDSIKTSVPIPDPFQVSVGFGTKGITSYIFLNMDVSPPQHWAIQGQPSDASAALAYDFYGSLSVPETINTLYGNLTPFPTVIPQHIPSFPLTALAIDTDILISNTSNFYNSSTFPFPSMVRMLWANVNDGSNTALVASTSSLYFTFYQQGIAR